VNRGSTVFECMRDGTNSLTNEVIIPITFVPVSPTVIYYTIVLQLSTLFSTVTSCTDL
jgi:hypothetical protein